jgi:hypothetical protein
VEALFVIGLALETAGGGLLAAEAYQRDPLEVARRGMTLISPDEPSRQAQLATARAIVGFGILVLGLLVQLLGYFSDEGWFLIVAVVIAPVAFYAGRVLADGPVASRLHGQAVSYWRERSRA